MAVNRLLERIPRLTVESFVAVERAEEARRMKSQFLANMSHDLRSPLNSILGFSELLLRGLEGPLTEEQRTVLGVIHSTGSQLLRLLTEILDTAKVESGKMEVQRQATPLTDLVTQALQEVRRGRSPSTMNRINVELQAGMPPISVDPLRMTQALTHLLNYAIDASHSEDPGARAAAADDDGRGHVTLRVRDGETDDVRALVIELEHDHGHERAADDRLFEGFRKVPGAHGLHLALPLARRLVELHGGQMDALTAGKGGIRVILPLGGKVVGRTTPTKGMPAVRI
jgi:signal transduction histidine kinase